MSRSVSLIGLPETSRSLDAGNTESWHTCCTPNESWHHQVEREEYRLESSSRSETAFSRLIEGGHGPTYKMLTSRMPFLTLHLPAKIIKQPGSCFHRWEVRGMSMISRASWARYRNPAEPPVDTITIRAEHLAWTSHGTWTMMFGSVDTCALTHGVRQCAAWCCHRV